MNFNFSKIIFSENSDLDFFLFLNSRKCWKEKNLKRRWFIIFRVKKKICSKENSRNIFNLNWTLNFLHKN